MRNRLAQQPGGRRSCYMLCAGIHPRCSVEPVHEAAVMRLHVFSRGNATGVMPETGGHLENAVSKKRGRSRQGGRGMLCGNSMPSMRQLLLCAWAAEIRLRGQGKPLIQHSAERMRRPPTCQACWRLKDQRPAVLKTKSS